MLRHLNREFGADFDLDAFAHSAEYNEEEGRIEIRLVSEQDQEFTLGDESFSIDRNEAILTEYSHKYTLDGFAAMAEAAGFTVEQVWMDTERLFSVQFLVQD
jgi:uncharacterized SAM-dependent methyltransferase